MAEKSKESGPKVFDVAKPGNGTTNIGSKPMIVGHKSLAEDPMVKEPDTKPEDDKKPEAPSTTKRTIAPISDDMKPEDEAAEDSSAPEKASKEKDEAAEDGKGDTAIEDEQEEESNKQAEKSKKIDPAAEQMERDDNLQKMIDSKKYFVTVHESASSSHKTFIVTFLIALIIGLAALAVLIDAEILDLGIDLPFDLL